MNNINEEMDAVMKRLTRTDFEDASEAYQQAFKAVIYQATPRPGVVQRAREAAERALIECGWTLDEYERESNNRLLIDASKIVAGTISAAHLTAGQIPCLAGDAQSVYVK